MRVQITIIYADGKYQDVLITHRNISRNSASGAVMGILEKMQQCINDRLIFYAGDESNTAMMAVGPDALAAAHFKCEILEDDAPAAAAGAYGSTRAPYPKRPI